jgi:hypothetical protein
MFFDEKEGTTPIVRLMNNFPAVDVIRAMGEWEPFDRHACGAMPLSSLRQCLDLVFSGGSAADINPIYERTATRRVSEFSSDGSVGFKMRFTAPRQPWVPPGGQFVPGLADRIESASRSRFSRMMFEVLSRHDVLVLLAVRQDLLRWALSKHHGDGTGRPGHIQFRLASGKLARGEIPRIAVDPDVLERKIERCRAIHAEKRRLMAELQAAGIDVLALRYEDFLADPIGYFTDLLTHLGHAVSEEVVQTALARGARVERVHGDDLSEFFINADELEARFGGCFERWP